jgi:hypothetical protein
MCASVGSCSLFYCALWYMAPSVQYAVASTLSDSLGCQLHCVAPALQMHTTHHTPAVHTAAHHTQDQNLAEGMPVTVRTVTPANVTAELPYSTHRHRGLLCTASQLISQCVACLPVLVRRADCCCTRSLKLHCYCIVITCPVTSHRRESGYTSAGSNASNGSRRSNAASVTARSDTSQSELYIDLLLVCIHLALCMLPHDAKDRSHQLTILRSVHANMSKKRRRLLYCLEQDSGY